MCIEVKVKLKSDWLTNVKTGLFVIQTTIFTVVNVNQESDFKKWLAIGFLRNKTCFLQYKLIRQNNNYHKWENANGL